MLKMKKLKLLFLLPLTLLTGCSNSSNLANDKINEWNHIHIQMGEKIIHDDVVEWFYNSADAVVVDVNLKKNGWVKVSFNNCLLYNAEHCPLCNK